MTASSAKTDRRTTTKVHVQFIYSTGLKRDIFRNVRLKGSWDDDGRYSDDWSTTPMEPIVGEDGCPAFRATVEFDPAQVDWNFHWGVIVDAPSAWINGESRPRSTT